MFLLFHDERPPRFLLLECQSQCSPLVWCKISFLSVELVLYNTEFIYLNRIRPPPPSVKAQSGPNQTVTEEQANQPLDES
jgi:hypothetical protein